MRTSIQQLLLSTLGVIIALTCVELALFSGILDHNYIWTPARYQNLDKSFNAEHYRFASNNPHRFNDHPRSIDKSPEKTRLAILGDSFVWGWSTRNREDIWSVKLGKLITEHDPKYEVLNWGRNGWATIEEFNFAKEFAKPYGIKTLIVGFVSNDLDLTGSRAETLLWHKSDVLAPIRYFFPNSLNLSSALINRIIESNSVRWGYDNWEKRQYTEENLKKYAELIGDFKNFCVNNDITLLFVMTPNNHDQIFEEKFKRVEKILSDAKVQSLNLYPSVKQQLGRFQSSELRVSRADGHPGPKLTQLFAKETFNFLLAKEIL